jgi:hypothetical protein
LFAIPPEAPAKTVRNEWQHAKEQSIEEWPETGSYFLKGPHLTDKNLL